MNKVILPEDMPRVLREVAQRIAKSSDEEKIMLLLSAGQTTKKRAEKAIARLKAKKKKAG